MKSIGNLTQMENPQPQSISVHHASHQARRGLRTRFAIALRMQG